MTPIMEQQLTQILHDFKTKDSAPLTFKRIKELFEETCHICLGKTEKGKKTCSTECTYKIRSINSRINVQSGKVKNDRGLSY